MDFFLWSDLSKGRNQLTDKHEPIQPFLFLSFLEFSGAQVVLDVGANIGAYALTATLAPSVECVHAFEPEEAAYQELLRNTLLNGVEHRIKPACVAVSDVDEKLHFGLHAPMAGVNGIVDTSIHDHGLFSDIKEVQAIRLDSFADLKGKVLGIKIDVEGHELQVIAGATELLKNSPAFVQVENYVGSRIDEALSALGYFRFFSAGHDHYFTNIRNFASPVFVKRAVEHAVTWLVEGQSGRWQQGQSIKNSLMLKCNANDMVIDVEAFIDKTFFADVVEYAFYLMVNGKKIETRWYQAEPYIQFPMVTDAESIEVKCFVRQKNLPDKKVVTGVFIKKPPTGFRADSAIENSYDLPSTYARLLLRQAEAWQAYPEVELSHIYKNHEKYRCSEVLYLGGDSGALEVAASLQQDGLMGVMCTPAQWASLTRGMMRSDVSSLNLQWHPLRTTGMLENAIACLEQQRQAIRCVILRSRFLAEMAEGVSSLAALFARMPAGTTVYTDALVNLELRQSLLMLTSEHELKLEWLKPRSSRVPAEWLTAEQAVALKINETDTHEGSKNPWLDEVHVFDKPSPARPRVLRMTSQNGEVTMHWGEALDRESEVLMPLDEDDTVPGQSFSLMRIGSSAA